MSELIIEHKRRRSPRRDTTISRLEARLTRSEREAQKIVGQLAEAMVRCVYVRDGVYNSRSAGFSEGRRAVVLLWRGGQILLNQGIQKKPDGSPKRTTGGRLIAHEPLPCRLWKTRDLVTVAHHLAPFLDALENDVRHQAEQLEQATATLQGLLKRIEADPRPSDEPAQMSEDPDVDSAQTGDQ